MKKRALLGMFTALALVLSYVETLIPLAPGIPGVKLGLANLVVVLVLYLAGSREALEVNLARMLLVSFLFGSFSTFFYSLAGALASLTAMLLCKKSGLFSLVGVSVAGGVAHNAGQLAVAMAVVQTAQVGFYLPWLILAGCLTGLFIGAADALVIKHLPDGLF